jgi:hypothetical protein
VDKHQQVPEVAQLWAVVMEFEKVGMPLFVTLTKHLLGDMFNVVVVDGEVGRNFTEIFQLHITV